MSKNNDILVSETELQYTIKKPSLRYIDEFIRCRCSVDLLKLEIFPNAKEITESMAMYEAVRKVLKPITTLSDSNITLTVVGDGSTPRTAALFAFRSAWKVYSIDPNLRVQDFEGKIQRLTLVKQRIQDVGNTLDNTDIILLPHTHIRFADIPESINPDIVIAMPCCSPWKYCQAMWKSITPSNTYYDWSIHSPHREIRVWTQLRARTGYKQMLEDMDKQWS